MEVKYFIYETTVFIFNQETPNFNQSLSRANKPPQTGIHLISAHLEMFLAWNTAWTFAAEMKPVNWLYSREGFTVLVCPAPNLNSVIKYWIAC